VFPIWLKDLRKREKKSKPEPKSRVQPERAPELAGLEEKAGEPALTKSQKKKRQKAKKKLEKKKLEEKGAQASASTEENGDEDEEYADAVVEVPHTQPEASHEEAQSSKG
jgi:hypothetical protein